jgi:hypothetical protein
VKAEKTNAHPTWMPDAYKLGSNQINMSQEKCRCRTTSPVKEQLRTIEYEAALRTIHRVTEAEHWFGDNAGKVEAIRVIAEVALADTHPKSVSKSSITAET